MYQSIVFLHDYEDNEPFRLLNEKGEEAAIYYLSQWDYGDGGEEYKQPWGNSDMVYYSEKTNYVLSYNLWLGYIALSRKVE